MSSFARTAGNSDSPTLKHDFELTDPPTDSISSLSFSTQANHLVVGSWDTSVRIYEVSSGQGQRIQSQGRAMYNHDGPVLSVCWNQDGTRVFSGSTDNTARIYDIASGQSFQIAQHEAPVKTIRFFVHPQSHTGILVTGSWDKTLKYWDTRSPSGTPIHKVTLPDKVYDFDVLYPYLVIGTAQAPGQTLNANSGDQVKPIHIFHLNNPTIPFKSVVPPLKKQIRALRCFSGIAPGAKTRGSNTMMNDEYCGFVVGGTEGRAAVQYTDDQNAGHSYSFKCHRQDIDPRLRDQGIVHAINDLAFHPVTKTLATCGSDGVFYFWNLESRTRLKTFSTSSLPANPLASSTSFNSFSNPGSSGTTSPNSDPSITTMAFNAPGTLLAYAVSYDWHKGFTGMTPGYRNGVFVKAISEEDIGNKKQTEIGRR
ncbi:RNA export factor gle2 [Stygiomarasmius scandens]|uniref:RNA export factor gle2 n=1 Tax=Marasmiellus scandens TaxID=2682957 RepID=A0ABR1INE2_9AGAR